MSARAACLAAAIALVGCADGRSVVTLTVSADAAIGNIDRLHIVATDDVRHRDANPIDVTVAGHTVPPDVTLPLAAPSTIKGALTFAVTALAADGTTVAVGTTDVTIAPSKSFTATVMLTPMAHRTLRFVSQPMGTKPNKPLGSVEVDIVDDAGTTLADATDVVSLTLSGGAAGSVLSGHVRVAAVAGVATFSDLSINLSGTGYTITAKAPMADPAMSASFDIAPDIWIPINNGLDGGSIAAIYPDPNDAKGAWAVALGQTLWRTKDGGVSWAQYGATLPVAAVGQLAISTQSSDVIFLGGSDKALRRSDDGGASWDVVGNNLPAPNPSFAAGSITVDPHDDSVVYYGLSGALFVSKDRGNNFTQLSQVASSSPILLIDPQSGALYLSGIVTGNIRGTFKSTDGGTTWAPANGGIPATVSVNVLAVAPSDGTLYARSVGATAQLYKSSDGGASWVTEGPNTTPASVPSSIIVDKTTSSTLYGGLVGGVWRSDDSGATWTPMTGLPAFGTQQIGRVRRAADGTLWGLAVAGPPYRSTDNHAFTFAGGTGLKALWVSSIDESCAGTNYCIGTESRGVFSSTNASSWNASGPFDPGFVTPIFVSGSLALVQEVGLWKTTDGVTWTLVPAPGGPNTAILSFAVSGSTWILYDDNGAIWISTNSGTTFTQSSTTVSSISVGLNSVIIDPTTTMTSYVWGGGFFFKSTNGGTMYTDVQPDPATKPVYWAAVIDNSAPGTLYVSTQSSKLYKTTNGGTAWSAVGQGLPMNDYVNFLGIDPVHPLTIYASTAASRMFKSSDGGSTFKEVAAPPGIQSFKIEPVASSQIYAATTMGVWRTTTGAE